MLVTLCILSLISNVFTLKIGSKAPKHDPNWQPQWVQNAIAANPSLTESAPISRYCQTLTVFSDIDFPGKLCIVSAWRDVSC